MTYYLESHGRMPVRTGPLMPWEDPQDVPPRGWCPRCGREIYAEGKDVCDRCEKELDYELCNESLSGLHPCGRSQRM